MRLFSLLALLAFLAAPLGLPQAMATPPPPPDDHTPSAAVEGAIQAAVQSARPSQPPPSWSIQRVEIDASGTQAIVWLAPLDPQNGQALATEPGLAVARRLAPDGAWQAVLPGDPDWETAVAALPEALMSADLKQIMLPGPPSSGPQASQVFSGYLLPWAKEAAKQLEGSIGHFLVYNPPSCSEAYCRYAFDFADGSMFPILAAKGGTVYSYKVGCASGDATHNNAYCTNYLVLKDTSTAPTTYQIYLHMAYNSLPVELRTLGASVRQGQYVGNADNTGYSTDHHLHFMVVTDPYMAYLSSGDWYIWGHSVDITFSDVAVNGGRPRTCYEAANFPQYGSQCIPGDRFTSGNQGTNPPTGSLGAPQPGLRVTTPNLAVSGAASDDRGVTQWQLVFKAGDAWQALASQALASPQKAFTLNTSVDLCEASVPDGPFSLGLYVWDVEGNRSMFLRNLYNDACHAADPVRPSVSLLWPASGGFIGQNNHLQAVAFSGVGGVSRVEFLYHSADWENGQWVSAGVDTNGVDGWGVSFAPPSLPEGPCGADGLCPAVYARAYDSAGNWSGDVAWNLGLDATPPTSSLAALPATTYSGAVLLYWNAADEGAGLDSFDLQTQQDSSSTWNDWGSHPGGDARQAWFIGDPGHTYRFRLRGVDRAGNAEAFPAQAEASTTLSGDCTPDEFEAGGGDNSPANATTLPLGESQAHNFCAGDVDWVRFDATAGEEYLLWALPTPGSPAAPELALYASDGATQLAYVANAPVASPAVLVRWVAPENGTYFLKLTPADARVVGASVAYFVRVGQGYYAHLPVVGK